MSVMISGVIVRLCLGLGVFLVCGSMIGCTDVQPEVSALISVDDFKLKKTTISTSDLSMVELQAQCSPAVVKVEVTFDGGLTWLSPKAHDSSSSERCENNSFAMKISPHNEPLKNLSFNLNLTLNLQFRVQTLRGKVLFREVQVQYRPPSTVQQELLAGSSEQKSTDEAWVLRGRVRALSQQSATNPGQNILLRGRILQ